MLAAASIVTEMNAIALSPWKMALGRWFHASMAKLSQTIPGQCENSAGGLRTHAQDILLTNAEELIAVLWKNPPKEPI